MEVLAVISQEGKQDEPVADRAIDCAETDSKLRLSVLFHLALWGCLSAAMIFAGGRKISQAIVGPSAGPITPMHSINRYVWGIQGTNRTPELLKMISALPTERTVVILMDEESESSMAGLTLAYLVWPRPVRVFLVGEKSAEEKFRTLATDSIGAVFFCDIKPPTWFSETALQRAAVPRIFFRTNGAGL